MRPADRSRDRAPRQCACGCRKTFIPKRGAPQKYHSAQCARKATLASIRVRTRRGEKGFLKRCEHCDRPFEAQRRNARFCRDACRQATLTKRDPVEKQCAVCFEPFTTTRPKQKYCGKKCCDTAMYDLWLKRHGKRRSSRRGSPALEKKRLEVQRARKIAAVSGEAVSEVLARERADDQPKRPDTPPAPPGRVPRLLALARLAFPGARHG